jgi:hypothetical protein
MDPIMGNMPIYNNFTPAPAEKKEAPEAGPKDEFKPLRPDPDINSLKDYGKNIKDSSMIGFAAGFIKTGNFVEQFMPSYDGLDHPGKHILAAIPPIVAGAVGGVFGAAVGFGLGLVGGNLGTHVSENIMQG